MNASIAKTDAPSAQRRIVALLTNFVPSPSFPNSPSKPVVSIEGFLSSSSPSPSSFLAWASRSFLLSKTRFRAFSRAVSPVSSSFGDVGTKASSSSARFMRSLRSSARARPSPLGFTGSTGCSPVFSTSASESFASSRAFRRASTRLRAISRADRPSLMSRDASSTRFRASAPARCVRASSSNRRRGALSSSSELSAARRRASNRARRSPLSRRAGASSSELLRLVGARRAGASSESLLLESRGILARRVGGQLLVLAGAARSMRSARSRSSTASKRARKLLLGQPGARLGALGTLCLCRG
mmetsp:Transcript_9067/g.26448  ORF Transcript_9067/g.26448 Transcript_9067/m.26448 type:complete len:301 (-) Transcript_9067:14-916(-)